MRDFIARSPKQLDLCLRMLYSEKIPFAVMVEETDKRKIMYVISIQANEQTHEALKEKYRILIS